MTEKTKPMTEEIILKDSQEQDDGGQSSSPDSIKVLIYPSEFTDGSWSPIYELEIEDDYKFCIADVKKGWYCQILRN